MAAADVQKVVWAADEAGRDLTLDALFVGPSSRALANPARRMVAAVAAQLAATPAAATVALGNDPWRTVRVPGLVAEARLAIDDAIPPAAAAVATSALAATLSCVLARPVQTAQAWVVAVAAMTLAAS